MGTFPGASAVFDRVKKKIGLTHGGIQGWQNRKLMSIGTKEGEGSPNAWKVVWGVDLKCSKQLDQEKKPCKNCQNFQHLGWIESHQVYFLNYPECGNYLEISTRALDVSQQGFYQIRSWIFSQLKPTPPHFCFSLIGIWALLLEELKGQRTFLSAYN